MHNDTPLGMIMHLKELDQQAAPRLSASRPESQRRSPDTTFGALSLALLRRVRALIMGTRSSLAPVRPAATGSFAGEELVAGAGSSRA